MPALRESAEPTNVPAAREDLLAYVLHGDARTLPQALVAAVHQNLFRGLLAGALHESGMGYWYHHAATVQGRDYAYDELLRALLPKLHGTSASEVESLGARPAPGELAARVRDLYVLYRRLLPPADGPLLDAPAPQAELRCTLPKAVRRMAHAFEGRQGLQLLLHGSLATCDAVDYSDVDTLLIVSHEWLESTEAIVELRTIIREAQRWLAAYDPTQHHGFMLVTGLDLERYARHYFPLELLRYAYALTRWEPVRYRLRPSAEECHALLHRMWRRLVRLEGEGAPPPRSRYALKAALSEMMLIPTYYLQVCGRVLYKRDSFDAVRDRLSSEAQAAMDELSAWRLAWRLSAWDRLYKWVGITVPEAIGHRILARARMAPVSSRDAARWRALIPGARRMAEELVAAVSA
ncbi:MAG: hypothetical protein IRY91_09540 [Gemmatimonadaceae bacterium]|nr:hypothetical protein [Gemmatimonadaceae bacterium]